LISGKLSAVGVERLALDIVRLREESHANSDL
jgi:hypothetical protein